ncbi:deoxyribonuclease V [Larsenimonas rhizosphaerae]|uniref:Endonuclease V n=1 Tax=Larsenimonas rhizosphaerae TaxID=2944682 RepID=A0AA42CTA8_9GAMM|nr:deoxyribonuclease V [Larsenimonas rhizosphaerae]MCM2130290.1 deoxyribonuclease V [Larsenimonas rhizosphaerae]MCX2522994.1 deoxyribonuclease V [Larsenimonas rhizosphaerae]
MPHAFATRDQPLHGWDLAPSEAVACQRRLADSVCLKDEFTSIQTIAGIDAGFEQQGEITRAAVVLMEYPSLRILEHHVVRCPTRMPYIPGLLSFRELPAMLEALDCLSGRPDLIMVDGMGIAHPRRLGIATHLGVWLDWPTIGVGKSRLCGVHDEVPSARGEWVPLTHHQETIGAVLRTRENVKPLYISPGHRICLESAVEWVMKCLTRYKLPEPTRQADKLASRR